MSSCSSEPLGTSARTESEVKCKAYPRRWVVLVITMTTAFLRAYNEACFGDINNVYAKYFRKTPAQIDWLMLVQSVVLTLVTIPLSIVTKQLSFSASLRLTNSALGIGHLLTALALLTRNGFPLILLGQMVEGFANILSWSLVPAVAALWFPSNEVAMAVATQFVARGAGEAIGCILPPYIVSMKSTVTEVKWQLFGMFFVLVSAEIILLILSVRFTSGPPTPPSVAESKVWLLRKQEQSADLRTTLKNYSTAMKTLFRSKDFVIVWFLLGAAGTILRTNNIMLSSILLRVFPGSLDIDEQVGVALAIAWVVYTVGGFAAGAIISKTCRYKEIMCISVFLLLATSVIELFGNHYQTRQTVFASIVALGFATGLFVTALYELCAEVTYPESLPFVAMILTISVGVFRLAYTIAGRVLLENVSPTSSTAPQMAMTFVASVSSLFVTKDYRRQRANIGEEGESLLTSSSDFEVRRADDD